MNGWIPANLQRLSWRPRVRAVKKTLYVICIIAAILISFIIAMELFVYESTKAIKEITQSISREFKSAFNTSPIITVNNRVVISESHAIAELATASKTISVDTTVTSTWLHSTKTISVHGVFVAKAGFDLNRLFKVDIRSKPDLITVTLPNPRILSLELTQSEITDEKGGLVNWLTPEDHEAALKQLTDVAKLEITTSTIRQSAKDEMEKRIRAMSTLKGFPVKIQYDFGPIIPEKTE